jgi:hypothetical protein
LKKKSEKISFSYFGYLNIEILENILVDTREYLKVNFKDNKVSKRIYVVVVEALENIIKHNNVSVLEQNKIKFEINVLENSCKLLFANKIYCNEENNIKNILTQIQNKSKHEIKELYKITIQKAKISDKGGAGLGFLEIAKVVNKIDYKFDNINSNTCEFILEIEIARNS